MSKERIILIDGSGYIFRAYYAIARLSNSKGTPTNAVFGFVNMLLKVLEDEKPSKLAITFDTAKPTFRKQLFEAYKANREKPPEDLIPQFELIHQAVECFGIPCLYQEGFEADDILATLATRAERDGYRVEIITGDKDLMQLVNDQITLYDTMKGRRIKREEVIEKFQVPPEKVTEVLALMGDSSDNIPGVAGIGPKTAAQLIQDYGSLEGVYEAIDQIAQPKKRATLLEQKEQAFLSRELATVKRDVPMEIEWETLNYTGPQTQKLQRFCEELEFRGLMQRLNMDVKQQSLEGASYTALTTQSALREVLAELQGSELVAIDTETTSLAVHSAECVGISLCAKPGKAYYIPMGHTVLGSGGELAAGQLPAQAVRELLKPLLESAQVHKVGQNLKYDIQILRKWGVELAGVVADTLVESYLLDPDASHGLDALAATHLGHQTTTYEQVTGRGKSQISFAEVAIDRATQYAAEDADVALRLHAALYPKLKTDELIPLYEEVEVPLIEVLADMEYTGVQVDESRLRAMSGQLSTEIEGVQEKIYSLAGERFNVHSPKQLSTILFEKLKLPVVKRTKTGLSTDESVLSALAGSHEICQVILRSRELAKLRSTYVEGLLGQIHSTTGRVHTHYNQAVTATGRLSSSNPNLQNIPITREPQYDVRRAFTAPAGCGLLSADYSQIELRLLADMSADPELLRAFKNDEDVHACTGRLIFGVDEVSAEQRRVAKTINFGVVYGQTPYGLSQTLGISQGQAREFIDTYFARYPKVKQFLASLAEKARKTGFAETRLGRRRKIPEIQSQNRMRREMAERTAINTPLQGTAADLIKRAMVNVFAQLRERNLKSRMIMQVHDELVLEVPDSEKGEVQALVLNQMESAMTLQVPLKVDIGWGRNWQEAK